MESLSLPKYSLLEVIVAAIIVALLLRAARTHVRNGQGDHGNGSLNILLGFGFAAFFLVVVLLATGIIQTPDFGGRLQPIEASLSTTAPENLENKMPEKTTVTNVDEASAVIDTSIWEYEDTPTIPPHGHPTDAPDIPAQPRTEFMLRVTLYTVPAYAQEGFEKLNRKYNNATIVKTIDGNIHVGLGPFNSEAAAQAAQRRLKIETYLVSFDYP